VIHCVWNSLRRSYPVLEWLLCIWNYCSLLVLHNCFCFVFFSIGYVIPKLVTIPAGYVIAQILNPTHARCQDITHYFREQCVWALIRWHDIVYYCPPPIRIIITNTAGIDTVFSVTTPLLKIKISNIFFLVLVTLKVNNKSNITFVKK